MQNILIIVVLCLILSSCHTSRKAYYQDKGMESNIPELPSNELEQRLFLVGDAGGLDNWNKESNVVFDAIKKDLSATEANHSIVFLGDNIYNNGLDKPDSPERQKQEAILNAHISLAEAIDGDAYFIPGNHDWNNNKTGGRKAIIRQGDYIKKHKSLSDQVSLYPENACGDPSVVRVSKDLVYIFIDTQWWVHNWAEETDINEGCDIVSRRGFLDRMKDILIENKNDRILIFMHHPLLSNGPHGGHFGAKDHLFPLTKFNKNLYLPLPFIGSLYPLYRQLGGSNQDITYRGLQYLKQELEHVIRTFDVSQVTFVSGHDHHLQHNKEQFIFQKFPINYIISGSGYKTSRAAYGLGAQFVSSSKGYGVMNYYEDGSAWLEFYTVDGVTGLSTIAYRSEIYKSNPSRLVSKTNAQITNGPVGERTTISAPPNTKFGRGPGYQLVMGKQYRPTWTTPINTDVFELDKFFGGLKPVKKGGGLFTHTLRLESTDGKQYVMRSVNKDFFKAVPKEIRHLEVLQLYVDQNAASIPYGALYIAALSDYAKVYHTDPQVVYLSDTSQLGPFASFFPTGHYILEARPTGNWQDSGLFGDSNDIIGYNDLLFALRKKTMHFVDQRWVLKSRLFDIFIHDRDRHDDQWRWAAFQKGEKTMYRPIPRDRDWAFFKYGGLIPGLFGNVADKKLKSIGTNSIDVKALSTNANNFDRYFLNNLSWDDWEEEIDKLLSNLTDEAIANSIGSLPVEIQEYISEELVNKLQSRRKILKREVKEYYDFISKSVQYTGTDEKDKFVIDIRPDGNLSVKVIKLSNKHGDVVKYSRILLAEETENLTLYGLADEDEFDISVNGRTSIDIRIVGGIGQDKVDIGGNTALDNSIAVYDDPDGIDITEIHLIDDYTSNDIGVNKYNRNGFLYDTGLPWITLGFRPDEGFTFGVGYNSIKHGWRKTPFKSSHLFSAEITPGSRLSYKAEYQGEYPQFFSSTLGFAPYVKVEKSDNINFFGVGPNEFNSGGSNSDNFVQLDIIKINPRLQYKADFNKVRLRFGPAYESYKVLENSDSLNVINVLNLVGESEIERDHFIGLETDFKISTTDKKYKPTRGIIVRALAKHQYNLRDRHNTLKYGLSFSWYTSLSQSLDFILAGNSGFQSIVGTPLFYQYPTLGNKEFLRPFRNERFSGETIVFQQLDLRLGIYKWNNTILPIDFGIIGGYDFGQVYVDEQTNGGIRHGWTLGVSYDLLGYFLLRTSVSGSSEGNLFKFDVGYAF